MFKGISTLVEYDQCIKKGLCEEHLKEIDQNEIAAVKDEFPRNAFKFIRINILHPFLSSNMQPKCEKMKKLMERTPPIAKVLVDGRAGLSISQEAANVIYIVDSVVIFTICQLSKVCCIGAIFHNKKVLDDSHLKAIQSLLLVERLNSDIRYLFPALQQNFVGFDIDVIRATHCITLLFIRKFCNKGSLKEAIEAIENDILKNSEINELTVICNELNYKNTTCVIRKTSTASLSPFNLYRSVDYMKASDHFYNVKRYELASFFGYLAASMEDSIGESYYTYVKALLVQGFLQEALDVLTYGIEHTENNSSHHISLTNLADRLSKRMASDQLETTNKPPQKSLNPNDIKDKILPSKKRKSKSGLVHLVDSESGGSDSEVGKETGLVLEGVTDSDDSSEIGEKKELYPEWEELKNKLPECVKENSESPDVPNLTDPVCSDNETDIKKKKQIDNGTKEKIKVKSYTRRKRTISEGSVDNQPEEEIDINKINSYLKETSEALLADCGYKALQIFRGPLRKLIDSSDFLSFEECDIVCIKYSYGIAYCKSGGHDDLEKCIIILKEIIEHHDSITFPAAHYSLGLAYRKLNRFKEALNYLEIVQNFLDKGIHFKVYPWPGMTTVIQETKPDVLKTLVQDLIKECENPPNPNAFCRYESCSFQPTIYYTDPDFKGYISLTCSEQCNLQFHLQCWKIIKEEKKLTDKEFLEKTCFTPDCEGFITKIQNIDKKGDLSKEFISEFKKPQKLHKKWDKKTDNKEKDKKKKKVTKYEGGSEEILAENGRDHSRKSSICEFETTEIKEDSTNSPPEFSGSNISNEEISCKSENNQKSSERLKEVLNHSEKSSINCVSSSLQDDSYTNHFEEFNELSTPVEKIKSESEPELMKSIIENTYSYMTDFLNYHGPLRIDEPLLMNEVVSFPDEIYNTVSNMGGIGEFLKTDIRFAFVGDLYVCIVRDIAKAYQKLNNAGLPTDFKNLQILGNNENSKFYSDIVKGSDTKQSSFLNPDAQEYTPTNNKSSTYKFITNNSHQNSDSHCSLPLKLESSYKNQGSVSQLDTFPAIEMVVSKSKSCEAVSADMLQNKTKSILSLPLSKEKNTLITSEHFNKSKFNSDLMNPGSNSKSANSSTDGSSIESVNLKCKVMETQILRMLNQYFSEDIKAHHQSEGSSLKPYIIKKIDGVLSKGTMTDVKFQMEGGKGLESGFTLDQDFIIESFKKEIHDLSKQNSSLQNVLECTTEQQQKLSAEVARLKKCLNDSVDKIESVKKNLEKKEQKLKEEKVSLVQSLSDANKFVGTLQQKNALLSEEKLKLQKNLDNMSLSLKKEEEKIKISLDSQEKKFNATIESLQRENAELKIRTKHAELQLLYMKRTEYLKRIDAKFLEVDEVKKEMNTPSMQLWANTAGPKQVNILSTKFSKYIEELESTKQNFIQIIDEQIKKIKNGASLKDLDEVVMKDLGPVPTYKNSLSEQLLTGMSTFNTMTLPYFGASTHMPSAAVTPVATASSLLSSSSSSRKISPPSATVAIAPPVTAATKILPHVAPISTKNIISQLSPSATIIPPSITPTPVPPLSSSVAPVLSTNKDKMELVSDIDPTIQESFKSAMASINSFASTPSFVPSLDEEFDKHCVVFKHPDPISNDTKSDNLKVPPGLANSVPLSTSAGTHAITPIPEPVVATSKASTEKSFASLDTVPKIKVLPNQVNCEPEKKKSTANYGKLLLKLTEQFPAYSKEELISYVKEVRAKRQGKLSGLTIDAIISEISAIMKTKKKMTELKIQPKPAKVLVNKKLVPDPPKPPPEPQSTKKKTAWNIDTDAAQRRFSGSADDDCTICYDSMAKSPYKVACGHFFHEDCIRQWLKKNSNCPICRVLLLLPEEYPSLS